MLAFENLFKLKYASQSYIKFLQYQFIINNKIGCIIATKVLVYSGKNTSNKNQNYP